MMTGPRKHMFSGIEPERRLSMRIKERRWLDNVLPRDKLCRIISRWHLLHYAMFT
jgi:hypothetical protein